MGRSQHSSSQQKQHKHKSEKKKQKKQKKEKKEKKQKKQKKEKHNKEKHNKDNKSDPQKNKQIKLIEQPQNKNYELEYKEPFQYPQKEFVPRTHVECRRCQKDTFSLKLKQCSNCGYPKEQRPANFPVTKEVDVMQMIRSGKLVHNSYAPVLIEVIVNDRMGRKSRIKCGPDDTILDFKKLIAAQIGTRPEKIRLQKSSIIYKDHLTLSDYEIKDGMGLQMYYD